jgi:hypothetical protein
LSVADVPSSWIEDQSSYQLRKVGFSIYSKVLLL